MPERFKVVLYTVQGAIQVLCFFCFFKHTISVYVTFRCAIPQLAYLE